MTALLDRLLKLQGPLVYAIVAAMVFAEDALFVGFVHLGETAAVLGGVAASLGHVSLPVILVVVALAAIGWAAVFLSRFVAFFRAVMPALEPLLPDLSPRRGGRWVITGG